MEDLLRDIYFDPEHPASYGGKTKLKHVVKNQKHIDQFSQSEPSYTLHKPVRKKYLSAKTISHGVDQIWQLDLCVMENIQSYNDNYKYILFVLDVYSRFLFLEPIKSKHSQNTAEAFIKIVKQYNRLPGYLHTDAGTEFKSHFAKLVNQLNIGHYVTGTINKASLVERAQRTIKERLYRYFTHKNTYRYIDVLPLFQKAYNNSIHRMTGAKPIDINHENKPKTSVKTNQESKIESW